MATSSEVKNRYNKKAYKHFSSRVKPDLYERIDNYCKDQELSKSKFLELAIQLIEENDKSS